MLQDPEAGHPALGPVHCITIGSAASMSRDLAEGCRDHVTSIVLGCAVCTIVHTCGDSNAHCHICTLLLCTYHMPVHTTVLNNAPFLYRADVVPRLNYASVEALLAEAARSGYARRAVDTMAASIAATLPQALPWVAPLLSPGPSEPSAQGAPVVQAMRRHKAQEQRGLGGVVDMVGEGGSAAVLQRAAAAVEAAVGKDDDPQGGNAHVDARSTSDAVPLGKTGGVEVMGQTSTKGAQLAVVIDDKTHHHVSREQRTAAAGGTAGGCRRPPAAVAGGARAVAVPGGRRCSCHQGGGRQGWRLWHARGWGAGCGGAWGIVGIGSGVGRPSCGRWSHRGGGVLRGTPRTVSGHFARSKHGRFPSS